MFKLIHLIFDTDWFPGWSQKYGAEPSSRSPSEDCVELRQSFPGLNAANPNDITSDDATESKVVKNQLYWNDQECRQENWFVCSKRITNPNKREKHLMKTHLFLDRRALKSVLCNAFSDVIY